MDQVLAIDDEALSAVKVPVLEARAALLAAIRDFFRERGFLEVETPLLCREVVVDRYLDPFPVQVEHRGSLPQQVYWLQTSPEYGMKRLLVTCRRSIYQITRAFRYGERGRWHNPEFTLLEWYEVGATYEDGMETTSQLAHRLLGRGPAERVSYREVFRRFAKVDPFTATPDELRAAALAAGLSPPGTLSDRDGWLEYLMAMVVEPHLGRTSPAIVYDYPAGQSALARVRRDAGPVAERFELYVDGIELANGYHELVDADELAERMQQNNRARAERGERELPQPQRLIAAMRQGMPPCTGVALGFDRLLAVRLGFDRLDDVLAFPWEAA